MQSLHFWSFMVFHFFQSQVIWASPRKAASLSRISPLTHYVLDSARFLLGRVVKTGRFWRIQDVSGVKILPYVWKFSFPFLHVSTFTPAVSPLIFLNSIVCRLLKRFSHLFYILPYFSFFEKSKQESIDKRIVRSHLLKILRGVIVYFLVSCFLWKIP